MKALEEVAKSYYGVTGLNAFDLTGDRLHQDYSIWRVAMQGGKPVIVDVEIYSSATGTFTPIK